jgi:hypothetical protein
MGIEVPSFLAEALRLDCTLRTGVCVSRRRTSCEGIHASREGDMVQRNIKYWLHEITFSDVQQTSAWEPSFLRDPKNPS